MKKLLLVALSWMTALGCAKDMSTEEYERRKAENQKASYSAIDGIYIGEVYRKSDRQLLGALQVITEAKTNMDKNGTMRAYIDVGVHFADSREANISSTESIYNPESQTLTVNFNFFEKGNGGVVTGVATLTAHVADGGMTGFLSGSGSADQGTFTLQRDVHDWGQFSARYKDMNVDPIRDYETYAVWEPAKDPRTGRRMIIHARFPRDPLTHFQRLFMPDARTYITMSFITDPVLGFGVGFPVVYWNPRTGAVESEVVPGKTGNLNAQITCSGFFFQSGGPQIPCVYTSEIPLTRLKLNLKAIPTRGGEDGDDRDDRDDRDRKKKRR